MSTEAPELSSIAVRRYRCFAEEFRLRLAPITLLYGWNNAGKSAALRLVGLLNDSLQPDARVPFVTTGPSGRNSSFRDLEWKGSEDSEEPGFALELTWTNGGVLSVRYQLDYSREREEPYVRRLSIRMAENPEQFLELRANPLEPDAFDCGGRSVKVPFTGLNPSLLDGGAGAQDVKNGIERLNAQLVALRGGLQWLGVNRGDLPRDVPREQPAPDIVGPKGDGTVELLVRDRQLREHVARWYASPQVRRKLNVRESTPFRGLSLSALTGAAAGFDIPLADTGAGMSQVLPVLTAASLAARRAKLGKPAVVSVEEPESQLHGNAMRELVDWLCAIAMADRPPSLLLETHSRTLLVAFQLAVADGKLSSDRFQVYWLSQNDEGATVSQIAELDERGVYRSESPLPPTAFADEHELNDLYLRHILDGDGVSAGSAG